MSQRNMFDAINSNFNAFETLIIQTKNQPYFYFKAKLIMNLNNNLQLVQRVIGLSKSWLQIFDTNEKQDKSINECYNQLQVCQYRLSLQEFHDISYHTVSDPNFYPYIRSLVPSCGSQPITSCLIFLKNPQLFQTSNLIFSTLQKAKQFMYCYYLMQQLRNYQKIIGRGTNLKIVRMLTNVKVGFVVIDTQDFGYGYDKMYQPLDQLKEINHVINTFNQLNYHQEILSKLSFQLKFRIVDQFLKPLCQHLIQLIISRCEMQQQYLSQVLISPELTFKNVLHLNLSNNQFSDQIFTCLNQSSFKLSNLQSLNLSSNYISLSSSIHQTIIQFLSQVGLQKLILQENRIKSLGFFIKYFINVRDNGPVGYLALADNTLSNKDKQQFVGKYVGKIIQWKDKLKQFKLVVDLGKLTQLNDQNVQYFSRLEQYHLNHSNLDQNFIYIKPQQQKQKQVQKQKNKIQQLSYTISHQKPLSLQKAQSRISLLQALPSNPIQKSSTITNLLQTLSKLYILNDYKQIQQYKSELTQKYKVGQNVLKNTFTNQILEKKVEENRIIKRMQFFINIHFINNTQNYNHIKRLNQQLESIVGIVRRRALDGRAAGYFPYLKYKRDQLLQHYLQNPSNFKSINPIYQFLHKTHQNYAKIFKNNLLATDSFLSTNYLQLSIENYQILKQNFFKVKKQINKQNQSEYDRLKYLLYDKQYEATDIMPISQTILNQLKLFPTKVIRNMNTLSMSIPSCVKITAKQALTLTRFTCAHPNVQILSKYSLLTYPFHPSLSASSSLSCYQGILSRLFYQQQKHQQILSFIQVINNFVTFLYYTPNQVSIQTVTYLNYILGYLDAIQLQSVEDVAYKQFLIEEMYLHIITWKTDDKLKTGILLHVFQYLTQRLICRKDLQKYILAFLLENQSSPLQNSYLVLNSISNSNAALNEIKTSWILPNYYLLQSLSSNGLIQLHIKCLGHQQSFVLLIPQCYKFSAIFNTIVNFSNPNHKLLNHFGITQSQLSYYQFFSSIIIPEKQHYYQRIQGYTYVGQYIANNIQQQAQRNVVVYIRRTMNIQQYHSLRDINYYLAQNQLIHAFQEASQNLLINIVFLNKLGLLQKKNQSDKSSLDSKLLRSDVPSRGSDRILQILSWLVLIKQQILLSSTKSDQSISSLFNTLINNFNHLSIINFKHLLFQQKQQLINLVTQIYNLNKSKTLIQKIRMFFIHQIGSNAFISNIWTRDLSKLVVVSGRFLAVAEIQYLTNQTGQIVRGDVKPAFFAYFNTMLQCKIIFQHQQDNNHTQQIYLLLQKIQLNNKNMNIVTYKLQGTVQFLLQTLNTIHMICKKIITFDNQLLYQMQHNGIGKSSNKNSIPQMNKNSMPQTKTLIQYVNRIPQTFIQFSTIRNKQNYKFQKPKQNKTESKRSLQLIKSQQPIKLQQYIQTINKDTQVGQIKKMIEVEKPQDEVVYSRKSSIKSLPRSRTTSKNKLTFQDENQKSLFRKPSQDRISNSSQIKHQTNSLHQQTSKKTIQQIKQIIETHDKNQQIFNQPNTQKIVNEAKHQNQQIKQPIPNTNQTINQKIAPVSEPIIKKVQQQVITNQRRSRKDLPKRRSSRQK